MRKTLITALLITNCFATAAYAASFDCTKAATKTEKLICADEKLSALDEQLATAYKTASETVTDKNALKAQQKKWLKQKRNVCSDVACLSQAYQARISALTASNTPAAVDVASSEMLAKDTKPASSNEKPITFKLVFGDSYPICKPYVDMLNAAKYMGFSALACERKILPEFPQFKAINWTEITDKKEMEKIMEENVKIHFASMGKFNDPWHLQAWEDMKKLIQNGEQKLFFYKTDLLKDSIEDTIYKTEVDFPTAEAKKFHRCNIFNYFYISDKNINTENAKKVFSERYRNFNLTGSNDLLVINDWVYVSHWAGAFINQGSNLDIYAINNTKACGILAQ
jgi:uncharacterized protein